MSNSVQPIFIISGEVRGVSAEQNMRNSIRLRLRLETERLPFKQVCGVYEGNEEVSFVVGMSEEKGHKLMQELLVDFSQESYLYSDSRRFTTLHFRYNKFLQLGQFGMITKEQAMRRKNYTVSSGHFFGIL